MWDRFPLPGGCRNEPDGRRNLNCCRATCFAWSPSGQPSGPFRGGLWAIYSLPWTSTTYFRPARWASSQRAPGSRFPTRSIRLPLFLQRLTYPTRITPHRPSRYRNGCGSRNRMFWCLLARNDPGATTGQCRSLSCRWHSPVARTIIGPLGGPPARIRLASMVLGSPRMLANPRFWACRTRWTIKPISASHPGSAPPS